MANLPIPDETTWIKYASQTGTGPFSFSFSIFAKADLRVKVGSTELEQSGFTLSGTLIDSGYDGGSITLITAAAAQDVLIWREVTPARTTDFSPASTVTILAIDAALDRLTAHEQDSRRDIHRSFKVALGETGPERTYAAFLADAATAVSADAVALVTAEGVTQVAAVGSAGTTNVASVNTAGTTQVAAVAAQGTTSIDAVSTQQGTSVAAVTTEGDTQVARVAATPGSGMYVSKAAGDAAGLATDTHFIVPGAPGSGFLVYKDTGVGTSTLVNTLTDLSSLSTLATKSSVEDLDEWAARDDMRRKMQRQWDGRPEAAIVVFAHSQSLGNWRSGTAVSGTQPLNCFMLVGGAYCSQMAFFATNATYPMRYSDVSSVVAFAEPAGGQGPLGGIAHALSGKFARVYLCSPAIGARTLAVLTQDGIAANVQAALNYLCKHAIDAGYRPRVVMPVSQGEADATANTGETAYYALGSDAYQHAQMLAVDAMGVPGEPVPLLFGQMMQMSNTGDKDREIIMGVNRLADDLPNAMLIPSHDFDYETDRVHPSSTGYFQKGYRYGWFANEFFHNGRLVQWPRIAHVKQLTSTSFRVYWSDEMEQHTTTGPTFVMGENLDANYLKGIGWDDNGTQRDVSAVTDYGAYSDFTVATITGTIDQQWCLHGMQRTTSTLTAGQDYHSGTLYRKTTRAAGPEMYGQPLQALSTYDHRPWARIERVRPEAA
jgi:hypothetical protein